MLEFSKIEENRIKSAIRFSNNTIFCNRVINFFNLKAEVISDLNLKFELAIKENKISRLWKLYLKNSENFKQKHKITSIDQNIQKLIFSMLMTIEINDNFIRTYTNLTSITNFYEAWFSKLLYEFVPPNEHFYKINKSCEPSQTYFIELLFGIKILKNYRKIELNEEQEFIVKTIRSSKLFDQKFYIGTYSDVDKSNIDPVVHYSLQGYKEGRNPSIDFDSNAYLSKNADVKSADVNPLYHYEVAGFKEKRQVNSLSNIYKKSLSHEVRFPIPENLNLEIPEFKSLLKQYDLIVMSHDDFSIRTGGVQKVIFEETKGFAGTMLHISPTVNPEIYLGINNEYQKGYLRIEALKKTISCKNLIIHSFLNFNLDVISSSTIFQRSQKIFLWAHDYSICCSNFLLLRNNYEACGAPPISSTACSICAYSKTRNKTISFYNLFIKKYEKKLKIVTPSNYSKKIIMNNFGNICPEVIIRNHIKLIPIRRMVKRCEKLRVAYVGSDQPHKGAGLFLELMRDYAKPEYYLFSSKNFIGSSIRYINHVTSSPNALPDLLKSHDIDVVIITSEWEETFCITAYEALAAGCKVYCLKNSGNLSEISHTNKNLYVFESLKKIQLELEKMLEMKTVTKNYSRYINKMNLDYVK